MHVGTLSSWRLRVPLPQETKEETMQTKPGEPLSFAKNIKPLFRESDRENMEFAFDLFSYNDVAKNADAILSRLEDGSMPCDGEWPKDKVDLFRRWVKSGKPA